MSIQSSTLKFQHQKSDRIKECFDLNTVLLETKYMPSQAPTWVHFYLHFQISVFTKEIKACSCHQAHQTLQKVFLKYLKNLPNAFTTGKVSIIFSHTHFNIQTY